MERDYEKLEGRVINVKTSGGPYFGRVIGCDPDIGITVVDINNPNHYLCCLIGPSAPNCSSRTDPKRNRLFFDRVVEWIENGCINNYEANKMYRKIFKKEPGVDPTSETCAFGQ